MQLRLSLIVRQQLISNAISLYGIQFAKYLLPLVTIPYLTRVLGPSNWGLVALTLAYGAYLGLPVAYGFEFSGTRKVAQASHDNRRLSEIFAGILGAKSLAVIFSVVVSFGVGHWVRAFSEHPKLLWAGVFASIAMNFGPNWYFQGLERMRLVAILDVSGRVIATAGIFLFVRSPADSWKVLLVWGLGSLSGAVAGLFIVYQGVGFHWPSWDLTRDALREGWAMFMTRSAVSLYTAGNSFILGLFAPALIVGYYAGAEKIARAAVTLLQPLGQTIFPRMSVLVHNSPSAAVRLARAASLTFGIIGIGGGLITFFLAPWLVRVLLGAAFAPTVPVLRILSLLLPLIAASTLLGPAWMLPLGLDGPVTWIVGSGALLNIVLGILLAPHYFQIGMAWVVVLAEVFVAVAMFGYLSLTKKGFWNLQTSLLPTGKAKF